MQPEELTLAEMLERFEKEKKNGEGQVPEYVRYCEGTDPKKDDAFFNKRLFIGDFAYWIKCDEETLDIKAAVEKMGYKSYADQRVPDGFGRNYDSTYYKNEEGYEDRWWEEEEEQKEAC